MQFQVALTFDTSSLYFTNNITLRSCSSNALALRETTLCSQLVSLLIRTYDLSDVTGNTKSTKVTSSKGAVPGALYLTWFTA